MAMILSGVEHDIGGLKVRRLLPQARQRSLGPFVFFDHIGPHRFDPGSGIDVRPHPHIGLATVTFLWEGVLGHRDSLSRVQTIRPGDVNWMTAGRGIVHSERTSEPERGAGHRIHGLQTWVALPKAHERAEPDFQHYPAATLPRIDHPGVSLTVVAGQAFGRRSPVEVFGDTLYVSIELAAGASLEIPPEHVERGVYAVGGTLLLDEDGEVTELAPNQLAVVTPGKTVRLGAAAAGRAMLVGGEPLDGPRTLWWNFVASDPAFIERAKSDWREGRFAQIPGETEFIPLP